MARPSGPKTRCNGRWTQARFNSFIKNNLRQASRKWGPINDCLKAARTSRGFYLCAECKDDIPTTIRNEETRKREKNVYVDHIEPIVPLTGWVSWDSCVERMFCEVDKLQVLCGPCHKVKSAEEAGLRKQYRQEAKDE